MANEHDKLKGHASMLAANVIWGIMSPMSKAVMLTGVTAYAVTSWRMIGAAAAFWTASLFTRRERVVPRDLALLAAASLLGIVFNQGLFVSGIAYTSPIDASVITTTTPIITMILAALILREPATGKKIVGVAIGLAGAVTLVLSSAQAGTRSAAAAPVLGDMMCLGAETSFALYLVVFRDLIRRYSPVTLMKYMFLFAAIVTLPFTYSHVAAVPYRSLQPEIWGDMFFIVFMATFVCYFLSAVGQHTLRPTLVSIYCYVQPVTATVLALLWGLDGFSPLKAAAVALVFAGVYLVTRSKSREQTDSEAK